MRLTRFLTVGFSLAVFAAGCSGGVKRGTVSGSVTLDGQPLTNAEIAFIGASSADLGTFPTFINEEGTYTIVGNAGPLSIPVGDYKVLVTKMVLLNGDPIPAGMEGINARKDGRVKNLLPEVYGSEKNTPLSAAIKVGPNKHDFQLKSPP